MLPTAPTTSSRQLTAFICLLLAASVFLTFRATFQHDFVNYDDDQYVYENAHVSRGLTTYGAEWAFTHRHSNNWHPLTWLSHMADCELFGLKPAGHHITSVALHAFNAVLLFLLLRKLTGSTWRAVFVAALFAIHPLRVESVAWISERKDVLSGCFFLLTLLAHTQYAKISALHNSPSKPWYAITLISFACGLMSKPMLVTSPGVLLLLDFWPLKRIAHHAPRTTLRSLVLEKLPFAALSIATCVATIIAQREAVASFTALPFATRFANALAAAGIYLWQLIWPAKLAAYYPYADSGDLAIQAAAGFVLLLVISFLAWKHRARCPWLMFGWLWFLGMLTPVIGIIQVGEQAHADRYTYLPQIGVALALVWTISEWATRFPQRLAAIRVVGGLVLITLAFVTAQQTAHWRNSRSLWERALAVTKNNSLAHNNLGHVLIGEGKPAKAVAHFREALRIEPNLAEAENNLGTVFMDMGRTAEAMEHYQRALKFKPHYAEANNNYATLLVPAGRHAEAIIHFERALKSRPDYPEVHYNLGNLRASQGRSADAITHYEQALRLRPRYAKAYYGLGAALVLQRRPDEAIQKFQTSLQIMPDFAEVHYNLGLLLVTQKRETEAIAHFQRAGTIQPQFAEAHYRMALTLQGQGKIAEAIAQYERAIAANPKHSSSHNNLAWTLATSPNDALRDGARAVTHALKANELTGGNRADALDTLAVAYAEAGRFDEALSTTQRALKIATAAGQTKFTEELRTRIQSFQSRKPYRESP